MDEDQIIVKVTDLIPPDNLGTVDKNNKIGNVYTKDQFNSKIDDVKEMIGSSIVGVLRVSDPKPTLKGKYELSEIGSYVNIIPIIPLGASVPTNTPITTVAGYFNSVYFDGTNFTQLRAESNVIPPGTVTQEKTTFAGVENIPQGKNIADPAKKDPEHYVDWESNNVYPNASYDAYVKCVVKPNTYYLFPNIRHMSWLDIDGGFISGRLIGDEANTVIRSPSNAKYLNFSLFAGLPAMIAESDSVIDYEPFVGSEKTIISNLYASGYSSFSKIVTPSVMFWAEGVEMNIYFKSAIYNEIADSNNYYNSVAAYRGKFLERGLKVIPSDEFNFILKSEISNGKFLSKNILVKVATITSGAGITRRAIVIGDSTINDGNIVKRIKDYFDADVMDVNFIGTRETLGVKHEGRGGWKISDYATAGRTFFKFNYSSASASKEDVYSINGSQYTVKEVNSGYFSAERTSGTNNPTATGTLTKVSGTGQTIINYTSFETISGNPFWNASTAKFDLEKYLSETGQVLTSDDWAFLQLGINDLFPSASLVDPVDIESLIRQMKSQIKSIVDSIHVYNSNIRIGIIQTIPPAISQNATGNLLNSSQFSLEYYVKKGLVAWWRELLNAYDNENSRNNRVYLIGATSIIDRENNFPTTTVPIDNHNSNTEVIQSNDVHPDVAGYQQIGDAYIGAIKYFA